MRPLDFIKTKAGNIGMITEVDTLPGIAGKESAHRASIEFFLPYQGEKVAWWSSHEFDVIDNLPDLLSRELSSRFDRLLPYRLEKQ